MVHAPWVQCFRVCEDISDGGSEMAPVRSQTLQRQGNRKLHTGRWILTQKDPVDRVTCLCLSFSQPVPPSPVEENQVWLAVNEDGLCMLDLTMVGTENASFQLRCVVTGNYVALCSFTLFPEHTGHISLPVHRHLWWLS